jgi:hypothetical protein
MMHDDVLAHANKSLKEQKLRSAVAFGHAITPNGLKSLPPAFAPPREAALPDE